jgi:hypothetical protein
MRKIALAFSFYLLVFSFAQAQENYLTLRGRVTDAETKEGLPAVTVYLASQAVYTQTNSDGQYVLKVPDSLAQGSVVYALMGYHRDTVLLAAAQLKPNRALRSDGGRWLREVSVTEYSPKAVRKLLMDAVDRIPQNYETDSMVGTWFYRDVRLMNGELFLFDEMVFDALRVGYDKHHKLKKLNNRKGPYGAVLIDYKRPIESNYTTIRHDRLLLCDTGYVSRVTNGMADNYIAYSEHEVLFDPVEVPNTQAYLADRYVKKAKNLQMHEIVDADGKEYYVITKDLDMAQKNMITLRQSVRITIAKSNLAIVSYEESQYFMMHPYFPLKQVFKQAGVDSIAYETHNTYHYGQVGGRYTLTSYTRHEHTYLFCAENSPLGARRQHMEKRCTCVLTGQHKEGASFLHNNVIQEPGGELVTNRRADHKQYDESFWQQYNYIPLESSIRQKLEQKLKK